MKEIRQNHGIPAQSFGSLTWVKIIVHISGFSTAAMCNYCKALRFSPGFNVDQPPNDDNYTAEIFAMVRDTEEYLTISSMSSAGQTFWRRTSAWTRSSATQPSGPMHTIRMQRWPRDLDLRNGLLSGNWGHTNHRVLQGRLCVRRQGGRDPS